MKKILPIIFVLLTLLLFYSFTLSSPLYAQPPQPPPVNMCSATACFPANSGFSLVSRPVPCEACCQTDRLIDSCADSFMVQDTVSYSDPCDCGDIGCGPSCSVSKQWGGTVTINMCDTTAPFVGKSEQEDEEKYLADYFDGTGFYYKPPYDFSKPKELSRLIEEAGVWRKLAPEKYQDELKKEMIERAQKSLAGNIDPEKRIHNYIVEYNGEWKYLADIIPKPEDPEAIEAWRKTIDGRLWPAVPMFSREDTIGYLIPWAGLKPGDYFSAQGKREPLEIPHLARLFEVSREIAKTLLPEILHKDLPPEKTEAKTFLVSSNSLVLGEKTLLAEAPGCFHLEADPVYTAPNVDVTVRFVSDGGDGDIALFTNGVQTAGWNGWNKANGDYVYGPAYTGSPFVVQPGQTKTVTYLGHVANTPACPGVWDELTCIFSVDAQGNFSSNCDGVTPPTPTPTGSPSPTPTPPPPGSGCCFDAPEGVGQCDRSGIEDKNPNDTICGPPLKGQLIAYDCFECTGCALPTPICKPVTQSVNRSFEVNLELPFLEEIWDYSTDILTGVFNIFRPEIFPEFEDLDAKSQIRYEYDSGSVSPSVGNFYFPHLGGIQKAKEWVLETLNPSGQEVVGSSQ